jgi:hypothetical protein
VIRIEIDSEKFRTDIGDVMRLIVNNTVRSAADEFYNQWLANVESSGLKTTKGLYLDAMRKDKEGDTFKIWLDTSNWLVEALEIGLTPFDMKPMLLKGRKYVSISFQHGTRVGTVNPMPRGVYDVARTQLTTNDQSSRLFTGQSAFPKKFQTTGNKEWMATKGASGREHTVSKFEDMIKIDKGSKYAGLIRTSSASKAGSSYITFRRVSENSPTDSWIHSGIQAHNLLQKTIDGFNLDSILKIS